MNWDKSLNLFQIALMSQYSISVTEMTKEVTKHNPTARKLMRIGMNVLQTKRVLEIVGLSVREAGSRRRDRVESEC